MTRTIQRRRPSGAAALLLMSASALAIAACNPSDVTTGDGKPPKPKIEEALKPPVSTQPVPFPKTGHPGKGKRIQDAKKDGRHRGRIIGGNPAPRDPYVRPGLDREKYQSTEINPIKRVAEDPVSTFSVDVDTGSYTNTRRFLNSGRLPPVAAVRIEEMVNYFKYNYRLPTDRTTPFSVHTEVMKSPWNANTYLVKIGVKGYDVPRAERPAANLVFLVDVSGSMGSPDKLPLLVASLKMLTRHLNEEDRVSLVVYAGAAGVVLEPTRGNEHATIAAALDRLRSGGSTAGGAGIKLAYAMAQKAFVKGGINRVIVATDGDFNVGVANIKALKDMVARYRKTGITLTALGFGRGNYNEHLMEQIANVGNGNYAYIDNLSEAKKVLVDDMNGTLFAIAKDVKIQVEFNPAVVGEYRLIGYENRMLKREDFRNDKVDAGEIGAGHTVTAIYEVALKDGKGLRMRPLRYGGKGAKDGVGNSEFAHLRLRYKLPNGTKSRLIEVPLQTNALETAGKGSGDFRFAAAVAAYGQLLRGGKYTEGFTYDQVLTLARSGMGADKYGYRRGFIQLVELARGLTPKQISVNK